MVGPGVAIPAAFWGWDVSEFSISLLAFFLFPFRKEKGSIISHCRSAVPLLRGWKTPAWGPC